MTSAARRTRVLVCKSCKGSRKLQKFLAKKGVGSVQGVGCQKVCKGPVAGVVIDGRMEWFCRLDERKRWKALARLARPGGRRKLPHALEKCWLPRRSGSSAR